MLEINTLSSPEIVVGDERVVNFVSRKALALVVYLAVNPGACSREELADLLWSDHSQERATGNLRVVLSDVRKKIGDYLSIDRHSVSIQTRGDIWVDVHQLLGAIEDKDLDLAVSLYKGDFLESFYVKGASRFENWQVIEREKIRLELVDGLSEAVHLLLKAGNSKEAIKYLVHLTTLEPLLESAHRRLMQAYFENGELSLALRQFEICKQVLSEELSVTPAEETMNLYDHIARVRSAGVLAPSIPHNLLNFKTPFIGQKGKTRELVEILSNPDVRHLSLVGPGGYGKSRLAIHLAKKCLDQFPDGVFWVPLQSLKEASELPVAISDAIGFIHQTEKDIRAELLDYLRSRQTLLVLDNFEHLLSGAKLVSDILRTTDNVKIVTTSRQKLNLKGETTYIVSGMDVPTDIEPAYERALDKKYDAIQLFLKSAQRSSPSFKPTNEGFETIARTCNLLEGMPLAIELAAGWVPVLSLPEIEREINKGFGFLEGKLLDVEERHRSLQAVAEGSWSLLTEAEKAVFKKLSIFKGPFRRRAAEKIAGAKINDLLSLSNKSFLQKDSEGLLRIHEWLRQFGESELRKSIKEYSETSTLFSKYYANYLSESWWEAWSGECQRLLNEWRNISTAILMAARKGNFLLLGNSMMSYFLIANLEGYYNEATLLFANLVDEFKKRELSNKENQIFALCLTIHAYFLNTQLKVQRAEENLKLVSILLSESDGGQEYHWVKVILNITTSSDWKRNFKDGKKSLDYFAAQNNDYAVALTCNILASRSFGVIKMGLSKRAFAIAQKHNGTREIAWALMEFGKFETEQENFEKAEKYLTKALSHYVSIQFLHGMIRTFKFLGTVYHKQGQYSHASECYLKGIECCTRAGLKDFEIELKELLGAAAIGMQDFKLGQRLLLEIWTLAAENCNDKDGFEIFPPEVPLFLEHIGYPDLAICLLANAPDIPFGVNWKLEHKKLLAEIRSRYPGEEMGRWLDEAEQTTPFKLAVAIRDALSDY